MIPSLKLCPKTHQIASLFISFFRYGKNTLCHSRRLSVRQSAVDRKNIY